MGIEVEPTFEHVTWKLRDFLELPQEDDFYVVSPEFVFGGDTYCLRLFPKVNHTDEECTAIHVRRLTVTFPDRKVTCEVDYVCKEQDGEESYYYEKVSLEGNFYLERSRIEEERDKVVPDGTFMVV